MYKSYKTNLPIDHRRSSTTRLFFLPTRMHQLFTIPTTTCPLGVLAMVLTWSMPPLRLCEAIGIADRESSVWHRSVLAAPSTSECPNGPCCSEHQRCRIWTGTRPECSPRRTIRGVASGQPKAILRPEFCLTGGGSTFVLASGEELGKIKRELGKIF